MSADLIDRYHARVFDVETRWTPPSPEDTRAMWESLRERGDQLTSKYMLVHAHPRTMAGYERLFALNKGRLLEGLLLRAYRPGDRAELSAGVQPTGSDLTFWLSLPPGFACDIPGLEKALDLKLKPAKRRHRG